MAKPKSEALKAEAENLIRQRIAAGFGSASAAASAMGEKQTTYSSYERGISSYHHKAEKFAQFFNISPAELIPRLTPQPAPKHVSQIADLGAGELHKVLGNDAKNLLDELGCGPTCFTLANPDRTMTEPHCPKLVQGDILGFDRAAAVRPADFVLAKIESEASPVFRIFYPTAKGGAKYLALNPEIEPIICRAGQWENMGRLQFVIKRVESLG